MATTRPVAPAGPLDSALPRLRPYQLEPLRAIVDSIRNRRGCTFTVMMSRQAGKNELSAQLEAALLMAAAGTGGNLIKASPAHRPQGVNSMLRLADRLRQAGFGRLVRREHGNTLCIGNARAVFLSAAEGANVVGATAHLLLEIDEAQDVSLEKFDKDFRPMGSTTNVTTVLYGTPWDDQSLLETVRRQNAESERADGLKRNFEAAWETVAAHNPAYRRFVEGELARLGAEHPLFKTQYGLALVRSGGGFFSETQRAQLAGDHPRQRTPRPGELYVAGLDLAGESEDGSGPSRRQDSTALTIARVQPAKTSFGILQPLPVIEVVDQIVWRGQSHGALAATLIDLLQRVWRVRRLVVDATGLGHTLAGVLTEALGSSVVERFVFGAASKSQLGFDLLAAVNAGSVRLYAPDGSPEANETWWQVNQAESNVSTGQRLSFAVPAAKGHDDLLMSLALAVRAGMAAKERKARGW